MKKSLLILAMLVFASQAMAATVTISLTQIGDPCDGLVEIGYTASADVSGFGLVITADNGAVITSVEPNHVGDCGAAAADRGFGIFPESFSAELNAQSPDWGEPNYTPVAPNDAPGATGTGIDTNSVILEMGALYENGNEPALTGVLGTFTVDTDCNVSVTADATRGNVVMADTTQAALTLATGVQITLTDVWWYPPCWDYTTQCHGDTDGDGDVDTVDWPVFRNAFKGAPGITSPVYVLNACADNDQDGDVDTVDWPAFRNTFKGPGGTAAADCTVDGDLLGVFEFYTP